MRRRKKKRENYFLLIIPALAAVGVLVFFGQFVITQEAEEEIELPSSGSTVIITPVTDAYHVHVDFKVFINGEEVNFNRPEFDEVHRNAHLHLGNPHGDKVIHFEGRETTIGFFFGTLGMSFDSECFVLDTGESFCGDGLRMFVNGDENLELGDYSPNDMDRILITYGSSEREIEIQTESVTEFACIFSGQCPDRRSELVLPNRSLIL